jgi:YhcH/YjgK/YiaL family protein
MYAAELKNIDRYDLKNERFQKAYAWLQKQDLTKLAVGDYTIEENNVIAHVQAYMTKPIEQCTFEAHDAFFDIQYLISGQERFGICSREGLTVSKKEEQNDTILYQAPAVYGSVILQPGDLIIVAPEEAHAPHGAADQPMEVHKVVVKVRI